MRISQETIIEALKTEPLKPGNWVASQWNESGGASFVPATSPTCDVCAVGAVLRHAKWDNQRIFDAAPDLVGSCFASDDDYELALAAKNYLGALSAYFESICPDTGATKGTRTRLVNFVKKNFPKTITVKT
jgi:hypothetical protein